MFEMPIFVALLIVCYKQFAINKELSAIRRYTQAQLNLSVELSELDDTKKVQLAKKCGLDYDPKNDW